MREKLINIVVLIVLSLTLAATFRAYQIVKSDRDRLKNNQSHLLHNGSVEISKTVTSKSVASAPAITLKSSEFKESGDTLNSIAKSMHIRASRIMQAATATTEMHTEVTAPIISDTTQLSISSQYKNRSILHYEDPWLTFSGTIITDTINRSIFSGNIRSRDTLDIIVHRVPKRFLFFRFGCKAVRMNISSRNRHTVLTYARYYQIQN